MTSFLAISNMSSHSESRNAAQCGTITAKQNIHLRRSTFLMLFFHEWNPVILIGLHVIVYLVRVNISPCRFCNRWSPDSSHWLTESCLVWKWLHIITTQLTIDNKIELFCLQNFAKLVKPLPDVGVFKKFHEFSTSNYKFNLMKVQLCKKVETDVSFLKYRDIIKEM